MLIDSLYYEDIFRNIAYHIESYKDVYAVMNCYKRKIGTFRMIDNEAEYEITKNGDKWMVRMDPKDNEGVYEHELLIPAPVNK